MIDDTREKQGRVSRTHDIEQHDTAEEESSKAWAIGSATQTLSPDY